jgi:rare lipoprotein A
MSVAHKPLLGALLASALLAMAAAPTRVAAQTVGASEAETQWLDLGPPHWDLTGYTVWDDEAGAGRWSQAHPAVARADKAEAPSTTAVVEADPAPRFERAAFETQPARTGAAVWYGPEFDGRLTATGERFDMYRLTAASRDLPLNSYVTVTNLRTGETVTVRVNDRPPVGGGGMITLSLAAATRLGLDQAPEAVVKVDYLGVAAPDRLGPVQIASR